MRRLPAPGWWILPAIIACTVGASAAPQAKPNAPRIGLGAGFLAPEFSAVDLAGARHEIADYRGKVLVLHFWATWCPYCRSEIPELTQLQRTWSDRGVRVLSISTDQDIEGLKAFVEKSGLPYPIVADNAAELSIAQQYAVSGIPVTYIIGPDGTIAERLHGASEIVEAVGRALKSTE